MKKPVKHKLDIFETLAAIDRHDTDYLSKQPEESRKGFASPVVLRWASAAQGPARDWYLLAVNERANIHHYEMHQHPDLQYRLLASCGLGKKERHDWIATSKSGEKAKRDFVLRYYPEANALEISIILQHLAEGDNLAEFLNGTGLQNDEIKKIKKAFE